MNRQSEYKRRGEKLCWRKRCWLKGDGGRPLKAKPVFHVSAILRFPRNNLKRNGRVSRLNVARKRHDDASTKQDLFPPANVCAHVFRRYRGGRIKLSNSYSFEYLLLFLCTRRMGQQGKKKKKKISRYSIKGRILVRRGRGGVSRVTWHLST